MHRAIFDTQSVIYSTMQPVGKKKSIKQLSQKVAIFLFKNTLCYVAGKTPALIHYVARRQAENNGNTLYTMQLQIQVTLTL